MTGETHYLKRKIKMAGILTAVCLVLTLILGLGFSQNNAYAYTISGKTTYSYQVTGDSTSSTSSTTQGQSLGLAENELENGAVEDQSGIGTSETETTTIVVGEVPLSVLDAMSGKWALMNLILTFMTALVTIVLLINYIIRRNERLVFIAASAVATSVATILFLLSENTGFPMQMFDEYTMVHVAILAVSAVCAFIEFRKANPSETEFRS